MKLIDFHCDTLYEMYKRKQRLDRNNLAVSLENASEYENYIQVTAIWSDKLRTDDAAYFDFFDILEHAKINIQPQKAAFLDKNLAIYPENDKRTKLILALEDARILAGNIERLYILHSLGLRILTPVWSGINCIGGAYDTGFGLTDFGREVIKNCFKLGIILDISHSSLPLAEEIFALNTENKPIIASHSDSFSVFPHNRNLRDSHFEKIKELKGLVGINLYTEHLGMIPECDPLLTVMRHIDRYLELGGTDIICFGCDFDGADTPNGFKRPNDLLKIADYMLKNGYDEETVQKLFWKNAYNFILKNIRF